VLVKAVQPGSPADEAGVKNHDVILAMDKSRWEGPEAREALIAAVKKLKPGANVTLEVLRGGETLKLPVTLGARPMGLPDQQPARFINGFFPAGPDFEVLEQLEKEAREAFFKDWLEQNRKKPGPP
jgi:C-terminal processing protease CtpA/Prc